jgi:hypothetical protein
MRKLIAFGFLAVAIGAIVTVAATANARGSNGRIVFARFDPDFVSEAGSSLYCAWNQAADRCLAGYFLRQKAA